MSLKKVIMTSFIVATTLSGCGEGGLMIVPTVDGGIIIRTKKTTPPRINSLEFYPKKVTTRDDIVTLTVSTSGSSDSSYQYSWKASKGTLLTNSGNTISWKPVSGDDSFESGYATITVTVSDGANTADGTAIININPINVVAPNVNNSSTSVPNNNYVTIPTINTSSEIKPNSTSNCNSCQSNIIFQEDFENGDFNSNWTINDNTSYYNYLTWKRAQEEGVNNRMAILTGPTNDILPGIYQSEVFITSQAIDLRKVKQPKLSFFAKSDANPADSVKLKIYWKGSSRNQKMLNVSFIPDKGWKKVDIDLLNLLSEEGGSIGMLSISGKISGNKNNFSGPMIDDIKVIDEGY